MPIRNSVEVGTLRRRRSAASVIALSALALSSCQVFSTDISNPNAVVEADISGAALAASALVTGLYGAVNAAGGQIVGTVGAASDELTWAGSREYWNALDAGDVGDPDNEYTAGQFPYVAQARWLGDYTVPKLESYDVSTNLANKLKNRADLGQAYFLSATIYTMIGESYENFVISSDRMVNGAPIGAANMRTVFDSAVKFLDKGVTLAQTINNTALTQRLLGMRARAKFSKAVWTSLRSGGGFPTQPLINDAGANADATAALAAMGSDNYRYRFDVIAQNNGGWFSTGFETNQRLELRAGSRYIVPIGAGTRPLDGLAGIRLLDPVTGQIDPVTTANINECCSSSSGQNVGWTATSAKEMHLILAEAALATGNTATFTSRINSVRAVDGLPAWTGTPSARAILLHERTVSLFLQGRRLNDHYRFEERSDRWIATRGLRPCFFPISSSEQQQNPLVPLPPVGNPRSTACQ